jgi:hypothetical protein
MTYDPRYFTTYYAIDAVHFKPNNLASALETIEGPYLPLVVLEAAGLPLIPQLPSRRKFSNAARDFSTPAPAGPRRDASIGS